MTNSSSQDAAPLGKPAKPQSRRSRFVWGPQLGYLLVAVGGTVGVTYLLLVLAGFFHEKVPTETPAVARELPAGAQVVQVQRLVQPRFETAVGTIKPVHESSVAAKLLARVLEVNVKAGQPVQAGDLLVKLDDADLQARLSQAQAALVGAEAQASQTSSEFARIQSLFEKSAVSQTEFEQAQAAMRTAAASVQRATKAIEEARVFVEYATITAPFDGLIVDKRVEPGDTVSPGQVLLSLYDPTRMQLVASVRESLAIHLKIGQQLAARMDALGYQCQATITEVVPEAQASSRSFQVKVSGPCPPGIYSGMFARLLLPLEDEVVLAVPNSAIRRVGQLTLVDVVQNQQLIRRHVQLGRMLDDDLVEVLSGLAENESVLIH
jgi:RND family efflux transporter MFP subunit